MRDDHERFQAQLAGHLAEVLSPEESAWTTEHASACDACRGLLERVKARLPEFSADAGHAPPALLSAWLREPGGFTPLERELLVRHLADCEACRADLVEMAQFAGLPAPLTMAAREPRHWRGYGAAGLVAAAALIAVVVTRFREPVVAPPPAPQHEAPVLTVAIVPPTSEPLLVFADRVRGGSIETVLVDTLHALAPRLRVRLPQLFLESSDSARVMVVHSGGGGVADRVLVAHELQSDFVLSPPSGNWSPGKYELRVIPDAGRDTSATRRYRFKLVGPAR